MATVSSTKTRKTRIHSLSHEFATYIPESLDYGVLYVSIPYATVVHLCCCGCGEEVVTPLEPNGWALTFNGRAVSLSPSIGNHRLACQSHYWIKRNRVRWVSSQVSHETIHPTMAQRLWQWLISRLKRFG